MTFDELRKAAFGLFGQERYGEALALVEAEYPNFPDHAVNLANWRICLLALMGRTEDALRAFGEAVAAGLWWSPHQLRTDPDLASLQGHPEFERLLGICEQRRDAAQKAAVPSRLTLNPEGATGRKFPLMIAMHGNNSNARATAEHWRPLAAQGWQVALLQSTQTQAPDSYIWNDRDWAVAEVGQHVQELLAEPGVDRERVLFGGFSMGGGLSIWLALSGMAGARGFVALGPWLQDPAELRPLLEAGVPKGLRGYIIVGDQDEHCHQVSLAVRDLMAEYGLACEVEVHKGVGHVYPDGFGQSLERATRFILG